MVGPRVPVPVAPAGSVGARVARVLAITALLSTPVLIYALGGHSTAHGATMPMVEATAPESFTQKATLLATTGWSATTSDQSATYPASNAIDGNRATFWHTVFAPTTLPLPHSITIDTHRDGNISGLQYLPRQDASLNGNIGQYSIAVSSNGTTWSGPVARGTWADDKTQKSSSFPSVVARFVRLTASTEAGNRGLWSTAAEIKLVGNPPADPALSRIGWVATDSDQWGTYPARSVLDGAAGSLWHTATSPTVRPLPHSITLDMRGARWVTGLTYLPRQDASSNGNIGRYSIAVSTNGTTWSAPVATGTWADDKTQKTVTLAGVTARYVKLTALSEAGKRGQWSSAAEINILSPGPSAGVGGSWGAPIGFPIVPVSAVVLPNNKLLTFSAVAGMSWDKTSAFTKVSILDLTTGRVGQATTVNTNHQMFCIGLAILADGRVLINGGSSDSATTLYNPTKNAWIVGPKMRIPRAYEADTPLSTGQVLTLGGSWFDSLGSKHGEVFTASGSTGTWTKLSNVLATRILTADPAGVFRADNHAWLFGTSNGGVFHAGPSRQMNWITTIGNGSMSSAGNRGDSPDAMNGNATMYGVGKILTLGGATAYGDVAPKAVNTQATTRAYTLDISGGPSRPVVTTRVSDMTYARAFSNSVVLPDAKVLVIGGQQHPQGFTDTVPAMSPELWDPTTGQFTVMAPDVTPRTYHSVAVLLSDGRVFSGGGGLCGACTTNHFDGRIFTPPYLLNADGTPRTRPSISSAPTSAAPGSTITVTTNSATPQFALVRTSAATHSVNNDQRRIPIVPTTTNGTTYTLSIPADRGVAMPGTYMLFALDANGTPSVSKFITMN